MLKNPLMASSGVNDDEEKDSDESEGGDSLDLDGDLAICLLRLLSSICSRGGEKAKECDLELCWFAKTLLNCMKSLETSWLSISLPDAGLFVSGSGTIIGFSKVKEFLDAGKGDGDTNECDEFDGDEFP